MRHGFVAPVDRAAIRRQHGIPENAHMFLAVGRNHPKKGYADLLDAARLLAADGHRNFTVVIAGAAGMFGSTLARLIVENNGRVVLLDVSPLQSTLDTIKVELEAIKKPTGTNGASEAGKTAPEKSKPRFNEFVKSI